MMSQISNLSSVTTAKILNHAGKACKNMWPQLRVTLHLNYAIMKWDTDQTA